MTPCDLIAGQLGGLFTCSQHGNYVKVRTPFLYPDGDVVDLFLHQEGARIVVSDLGESLRWLKGQTASMKRSPRQRQLLDDIALTNGVEVFNGMLIDRAPMEGLAEAVMRVGQAAVRVGDLWFTISNRTAQTVTDDVADFLENERFRFQRNDKHHGRSQKVWTVDFHVLDGKRSFVNVLATGSQTSAQVMVNSAVSMWHDLKGAFGVSEFFVSLVDDNSNVWREEDIRRLSDISDVQWWTQPRSFAEVLRANESVPVS